MGSLGLALGSADAKLQAGQRLEAGESGEASEDLLTQAAQLALPNGVFDFNQQRLADQADAEGVGVDDSADGRSPKGANHFFVGKHIAGEFAELVFVEDPGSAFHGVTSAGGGRGETETSVARGEVGEANLRGC